MSQQPIDPNPNEQLSHDGLLGTSKISCSAIGPKIIRQKRAIETGRESSKSRMPPLYATAATGGYSTNGPGG